ncbi:hypothetical protein ACQUSR_01210 [Streptomyces sp. P1-3]
MRSHPERPPVTGGLRAGDHVLRVGDHVPVLNTSPVAAWAAPLWEV